MPIIKNGLLNQCCFFFSKLIYLAVFFSFSDSFLLHLVTASLCLLVGGEGVVSVCLLVKDFFVSPWPGGRHMTKNRSNERKHIMMGKGSDSGF